MTAGDTCSARHWAAMAASSATAGKPTQVDVQPKDAPAMYACHRAAAPRPDGEMCRPSPPQLEAADAGQRRERRPQRREVIGMEDAAGQAVDDAVGQRPGTPERYFRTTAPPGEDRTQHGERQGPGELHGKARSGKPQRSDRHGVVGDEARRLRRCGRRGRVLRTKRSSPLCMTMSSSMELSWLLPAYGRLALGVRSNTVAQESDTTASVTAAVVIQPSRRRQSSGCRQGTQPNQQGGPADQRRQHLGVEGEA